MIGALAGNVVERLDEVVIVDVHGVGYEVTVSSGVLSEITSLPHPVRLTIFTDVRENAIALFGFRDNLERQVFNLLKKVKGIGARTAMTIVSAVGPHELLMSVGRNDIGALKRVPGVGNKTAERLILELREHVSGLAASELDSSIKETLVIERSRTGEPSIPSASHDVITALEKLGFPGDQARRVVQTALGRHEASNPGIRMDAGELLRLALGNLGERQ